MIKYSYKHKLIRTTQTFLKEKGKTMQDFDNDNYNRNPYAKNTDGNSGENAQNVDEKADKLLNADVALNDESGKYDENYQKEQQTPNDDNPYADYYVHKSNGYIPPESNGYNDGGQKDDRNASDNSYGNPYDKINGAFGGAAMPEQKTGRGMAIASMILGIVSIIFCCFGTFVTVTLALTGLILGIVSQAQKSSDIAVAGIITSAFGLVFGIIGVALFAVLKGYWSDIINGPKFPFDSDEKPFPPDGNNQAAISDILFSIKLFLGL